MMRKFLLLPFLLSAFSVFAQQHVILIIADDVGPDYFGFYNTTTDTAKAPNIRSLASAGIKFNKVWSAPVCSPARAGIFTGRYPFRTGVGSVITNATSAQLDTNEVSIAKLLRTFSPMKYNTGSAGKWHLHANIPPQRIYPNKMGFDFYSGNFNGAITDYYSYIRIRNGIQDTVANYATTQTVDDAISWMDTMNSTKPFFLWLAFNAPHSPFHVPPVSLCDTTGLSGTAADILASPEKYFKSAIQAMDTEIGRLFQYLDAHNLRDSTNIIFIGDNGNDSKVAQITNPSKAKGTVYDYGVRVPMIVSGPAVINPGRSSDELVNTPDLFATIAELGGFVNWKNFIPTGTIIDSRSLLSVLKDQPGTRTWIFSEQFHSPAGVADGKTIRNQDYHLLRFDNGNEAFYNQSADPEENTNLLLNAMTATEISNYHFLCDSLTALTGTGTCKPLQLADLEKGKWMKIIPNPVHNILEICIREEISSVRIFNQLGGVVLTTSSKEIDLTNLSAGVYYVALQLMNGEFLHEKIELIH